MTVVALELSRRIATVYISHPSRLMESVSGRVSVHTGIAMNCTVSDVSGRGGRKREYLIKLLY
jgi:hypothetical protein